MTNNNKKEKPFMQKILQPLTLVSQFGFNMIAPIGTGIAAGYYVDKWLGSSPWALIFLTVMGIGAAYKNAFITFSRYMKDDTKEKDDGKKN